MNINQTAKTESLSQRKNAVIRPTGRSLCVAAMLCASALAPILPVEAQTCMTESLMYTYEKPAAQPTRHKAVKKATANISTAKVATEKVGTSTQVEATQTAAANSAPVHIAESSLTTMRNHP